MNKKTLYSKAYRILADSTPLKFDCGTLCDRACCKGDENTGMHLFPGEEIMFDSSPGFIKIKPTDMVIKNGRTILLAVCRGYCHRNLRPLGCRIFPLTPYTPVNNTLCIALDPRAKLLCPIAQYSDNIKINRLFIKNVRKVFQLLMQDGEIYDFVKKMSRYLDKFYDMDNHII